jgi:hypothetical protein
MNGTGSSSADASNQNIAPTRNVEEIVPTVARMAMTHFCWARSFRLTCRAPANSRKLSMPCISVSLKSMRSTKRSTANSSPGKPSFARAMRPRDIANAMNISPIAAGSLM